jgi:hypothetical protein
MARVGTGRESGVPAFDLAEVQRAFRSGRFRVTGRVERHLYGAGLSKRIIRDCVSAMGAGSFHKSQELRDSACSWADIYRPYWSGDRWYVKFALDERGGGFRVLTFCRDGEDH